MPSNEEILASLPTPDQVGDEADWSLYSDGEIINIYAKLLGIGPSPSPHQHRNSHPGREFAAPKEWCIACRWFEPRIFREIEGDRRYLLHRAQMTIVPGEKILTRHEWALTGHELIELLTIRRDDRPPFLTMPAGRVLAQAAGQDEELDNAWVNRATA